MYRGSLFQPAASPDSSFLDQQGKGIGRSALGAFLALLAEALLVLAVLTLGSSIALRESNETGLTVVRLEAAPHRQETPPIPTKSERDTRQARHSPGETAERTKMAAPPPQLPEEAAPPQLIRLSPAQMAALDTATAASQPVAPDPANRPKMGPPDTGMPTRDTPRVSGAGPNGEPLYAASWYREPYDDELRGYLSTASGPGWGLIACRTAPDYRVEDCVKVDEYPIGSNIARSVLAAAWQFRVRPPRIGGEPKIGEWVRIRIDYDWRR